MNSNSDDKYIEAIREALWRGSAFGKAAVMVGAGFSRNAEPRSPSSRSFPLWSDMVQLLVEGLYPVPSFTKAQRDEVAKGSLGTSSSLRLAEEYEAAFGRQKLDDLLLQAIPDAQYHPGKIHHLLLQLPWSDVLTTNYDTLLERARDHIVEYRYSVVNTIADIPQATRPRIVKLHGSFPSHRPFIFTEEDFRQYPTRFAPFVNLAQQVVMENIVCLLGYSGDDPNFLYWTGWVRDNLGAAAPRVYLCGLLNLTDSQRLVLTRRNVVPVDLSPRFPPSHYLSTSDRHRAAAEWFLLTLEAGRPLRASSWPFESSPTTSYPTLPPLLPPRQQPPGKELLNPHE